MSGPGIALTCRHDWRIDPVVLLPTYPPERRLVCAECGAVTARVIREIVSVSNDPKDWARV